MNRVHVGAVIGLIGGVGGIIQSIQYIPRYAGLLFEIIGWLLGLGISVSTILGAIIVRKGNTSTGTYLMLISSLLYVLSWPLSIALPTDIISRTISGIMFILAVSFSPWPILSFVGSILVFSTLKMKPVTKDTTPL